MHCALVDRLLKGCCLGLATCLIYRHFFHGGRDLIELIPFVISYHSTTIHFSPPCLSHSALNVAKAAWRAEKRLKKLLSETEQRKLPWYTFSNGVAAMYCIGGIIASWIPSIYILSKNVSLCWWKQRQNREIYSLYFVNQCHCLYCRLQSISVLHPAVHFCEAWSEGEAILLHKDKLQSQHFV